MDYLFRCCSVYETRASLFPRTTSLVSHLPSISLHSIALSTPDFPIAYIRTPPKIFISSKFSLCISCEATPTKQSLLSLQIQEKRERRRNAMKDFLLQECCFSSSEITLLIRKDPTLFRRKSVDRAHQMVQMFRDCGFTIEGVKKTILRHPNVLSLSVIHTKPKIEYLKTLGIAEEVVNNIVSKSPRILSYSLDTNLAPKILFLIKLFGSKANLLDALRKEPGVLSTVVEKVNDKLKVLENAGLRKHEIERLLEKDPRFLFLSAGKIEKNMEFLTCFLGLKPNVVGIYPILLNYSVEKRMRPRYKVLQYLHSLGARIDVTTVRSVRMSEENFTLRFLSYSPEVKMLYEKYKGKTVDVEVPELLPTHQI